MPIYVDILNYMFNGENAWLKVIFTIIVDFYYLYLIRAWLTLHQYCFLNNGKIIYCYQKYTIITRE